MSEAAIVTIPSAAQQYQKRRRLAKRKQLAEGDWLRK